MAPSSEAIERPAGLGPAMRLVARLACPARVNQAALSPDGRLLAMACADGTLRLADLGAESPAPETLLSHCNPLYSVVFSPDGSRVAAGGQYCNGEVFVCTVGLADRMPGAVFASPTGMAPRLRYTGDGRFLLGANIWREAAMFLWDAGGGRIVHRYDGFHAHPHTFDLEPGSSWFAAGEGWGAGPFRIRVMAVGSGECLAEEPALGDVLDVAVIGSEGSFITAERRHDTVLRGWSYDAERRRLAELWRAPHPGAAALCALDEGHALLAMRGGEVLLIDADDGETRPLIDLPARLDGVAFNPEARLAALWGDGGEVMLLRFTSSGL